MFQPVSLFVGLRYAKATKGNAFISFISFFSIAGIALGLMSLITVSSVMNGFENSLKNAMLNLIPHVQLKHAQTSQNNQSDIVSKISSLQQVKRVHPYLTSDVILQTNKELQGVRLQGLFGSGSEMIKPHIENGSLAQLNKGKYQLAISRYLANKLDVSLGSQVRVILPEISRYSPMGRVPMQRLFTISVIYNSSSEADTSLAFADGKSLARLMRRDTNALDYSVTLNDAFNLTSFYSESEELLKSFEVVDWQVQQGALFAAVAMEKRVMSLLLGLIVLVAIFNIISALSMMVKEKQGEVAILQTIGFTPKMIARVFMVQGIYNGVIGTALGVVLGLLLAANINEIMHVLGLSLLGGLELPVEFSIWSIGFMVLLSITLSFVATLYPAKQAASVLPAEVLRYE